MKIRISGFARRELEDASRFYEVEQPGLGIQFENVVQQAIVRIQKFPMACPFERGEVRKCLLHKFPYKILYSIQNQEIIILAIAHQHRRPDYWIDSLE